MPFRISDFGFFISATESERPQRTAIFFFGFLCVLCVSVANRIEERTREEPFT